MNGDTALAVEMMHYAAMPGAYDVAVRLRPLSPWLKLVCSHAHLFRSHLVARSLIQLPTYSLCYSLTRVLTHSLIHCTYILRCTLGDLLTPARARFSLSIALALTHAASQSLAYWHTNFPLRACISACVCARGAHLIHGDLVF
eukprot:996676-Pleurochrysis_carterae.AAC.1